MEYQGLNPWSAPAAYKKLIDKDFDPMGNRHALREAPTMQDLWERYRDEWLPRKALTSRKNETSMWEKIVLPKLGKETLVSIEAADIDKLHQDITTVRKTPTRANRVIASVRKAFNLAIRWNWIDKNPVIGVRRNHEERRNRYLNKNEIAALAMALNAHHEHGSANAIKLLMLTGARKNEVLSATWDMFDLENGIWTKPSAHTKQRKLHRVPLSAPALKLLIDIKQKAEVDFAAKSKKDKSATKTPYVFPGLENKPLVEIKKTWLSVCKAAGLIEQIPKKNRQGKVVKDKNGLTVMIEWPNVRIHDLRHSFASILVSSGASLPLIGQMLGHTQITTTERYAHLYDDPLRKAADMVGHAMPMLITTDSAKTS